MNIYTENRCHSWIPMSWDFKSDIGKTEIVFTGIGTRALFEIGLKSLGFVVAETKGFTE